MVLPWGVYLCICQFWAFSIIFSMEFEVGHLKEPFFLSRIPFCLIKNNPLFMSNIGLKMAIFNKNAIKYTKWPLLTAYNSSIWPHFLVKKKCYSTQKKRLFQMAYFKFHEKNYWESSKLANSKINPSRENCAHLISCKPPHKNHPREYFVTTLWFIQIATSVVEKSQILSVAFHLSATVTHRVFVQYIYIYIYC